MRSKGAVKESGIRSDRICPRCGVNLFLMEKGGERLDVCRECGGVWFDPHELECILGEGSAAELLVRISDELEGEHLLCPSCRKQMRTKEVYQVYIDQCDECLGIWLDKGETEKIWETERRTKDPFGLSSDEKEGRKFWDSFREKYCGFEMPEGG